MKINHFSTINKMIVSADLSTICIASLAVF